MVSVACPPLLTYAFQVTFSLYYDQYGSRAVGHVWFIYPMALSHGVHCISVILVPLSQFNHSWCSWTDLVVLPYSRVVLLSIGIVPWCMWHLHLLCPYCTTTPAQLIVICLVLLLPLCHVGSIWWSCLRYMWILCPLAPSHGICGMSTSADRCILCHILIVLWIIMGSRAVGSCGLYILWHCLMVSTAFLSYLLLQSNHS